MRQSILKNKGILFSVFTFAISWSAWFLMACLYQDGQLTPVVYLFSTAGALGPLLSLVILEKRSKKVIAVKQVLVQIRLRGVKAIWFLPAIFALPIITLLGNVGYFLLGQEASFRVIKPSHVGASIRSVRWGFAMSFDTYGRVLVIRDHFTTGERVLAALN